MQNRLLKIIKEARRKKAKLFRAYLTLGYPSVGFTGRLIEEFEKIGVDIVELGFPFSDPIADGPTIQASSGYALRRNVKFKDALKLVSSLRRRGVKLPILFFSYYNPIFQHGLERFAKDISSSGFDGVVAPDFSPEEDSAFPKVLRNKGLPLIYLIAPTSSRKRIKMIADKTTGFIYYVSLKGVTGARKKLDINIASHISDIRKTTKKPVLIGFGVSSPEQARRLARLSDGVIVGSAFVDAIRRSKGRIKPLIGFVSRMVLAAKGRK